MMQQAAIVSLALVLVQLASQSLGRTEAFPLLFNRGSLFKRTNAQQQAQHQAPQDQLVPLANSQAPAALQQQHHFGQASQMNPAELMRLGSLQGQLGAHPVHQFNEQQRQQQQQQQQLTDSGATQFNAESLQLLDAPAHTVAYYKPSLMQQRQAANHEHQQQFEQTASLQPNSFDLYEQPAPAYQAEGRQLRGGQEAREQMALLAQQKERASQLNLEPSHTSEVVDKIEQHIDRQIERGLAEQDERQQHQPAHYKMAAAGYHLQHGHKEQAEKEAAASGEAGEEASGGEGGEEKAEKKAESSEPEVKEQEHQEHHEEHPPEAFEIHHKKGGKSFQYFHQKHSH